MFTRLERRAYAPIAALAVALALWVVVLPAAANAKETSQAKDSRITNRDAATAEHVVVAAGDSLWSISANWLGPEATARQIADGVQRIYTLNQKQIGSNPNLVFAGQRLLLPSDVERQPPVPDRAASVRHAGKPTASSTPLRAANNGSVNGSDVAAGAAVGEADNTGKQAPDVRSRPTPQPELARVTPVAAVESRATNDSSPSPPKSVMSKPHSVFSAVVATAGEAFSLGAYSGRKLLGCALLAMSAILALILVVHVAREVWAPRYARRRARERWMREVFGENNAWHGTFDTRDAYVAWSVAFDGRPSGDSPKKAADQASMAKGPRTRAPAGRSESRGASSNDVRKIARSRQIRMRQTRPLEARRPPRGHMKDATGGLRPGQARRRPVTRAHRTLSLRRTGGRIVGSEPRLLNSLQEWKIGEPLERAIGAIPVWPGAPLRDALLGAKPLAADELRTVALLERHRGLTDREQRQAHKLRRFLAKIEEICGDEGLR